VRDAARAVVVPPDRVGRQRVAHIYFLIGFRDKLLVMIEWCWAYVTFERHARIILRLQRD
jgi:hypothetical protein